MKEMKIGNSQNNRDKKEILERKKRVLSELSPKRISEVYLSKANLKKPTKKG